MRRFIWSGSSRLIATSPIINPMGMLAITNEPTEMGVASLSQNAPMIRVAINLNKKRLSLSYIFSLPRLLNTRFRAYVRGRGGLCVAIVSIVPCIAYVYKG